MTLSPYLRKLFYYSMISPMNRRTKSLHKVMERLIPFAEEIGWEITPSGGKWLEQLVPARKWLGDIGPFVQPTIKLIGPVVAHIRNDHPNTELVRTTVRFYGKVPTGLWAEHHSALEWLKLTEEEL